MVSRSQVKFIKVYRTPTGRVAFTDWVNSLKSKTVRHRLEERLVRLANGHFGDCKSVGEGVFELRLFFSAGFRVYFAEYRQSIILLLCGGDKSTQTRDIQKAKAYWKQFKENIQ